MAAMAAIRLAGRRLVGGGRLPQALNQVPRVPSRRPMSSPAGLDRPNLTQNLQSHGIEKANNLFIQVQQKKELLYNLICEHGYVVNGKMCMPNLELLHHLSAQIKPRTNNFACPVVTIYGGWIAFKVTKDRFMLRGEEDLVIS